MSTEKRTLLIKHDNGDETQIEIDASWKVTLGPLVVGGKEPGKRIPIALRVYETETLQRAVFTDVTWFRDMSIPIKVKRTSINEKDGFVECDGIRKRTTFQATTTEWINPDTGVQSENLLKMPEDSEIFGDE